MKRLVKCYIFQKFIHDWLDYSYKNVDFFFSTADCETYRQNYSFYRIINHWRVYINCRMKNNIHLHKESHEQAAGLQSQLLVKQRKKYITRPLEHILDEIRLFAGGINFVLLLRTATALIARRNWVEKFSCLLFFYLFLSPTSSLIGIVVGAF